MNEAKEMVIPVVIKVPKDVHAWLHQQAKADRRSAHSLILRLLEKAKEQETSHAPA